MGAIPKRRISRTRQGNKRAHYLKLKLPTMVACPKCGVQHLAHAVCPSCGTYKGVEVLKVDTTKA